MILSHDSRPRETRDKMGGGEMHAHLCHILSAEQLLGHGRLFSSITLPPGASIGVHEHKNERECYCIVSGTAQYFDNGAEYALSAGDVTLTGPHGTHGIVNTGDTDLVLIALILNA